MKELLVRLDDACEFRNSLAWARIERILDLYEVRPLVGIIPCCRDKTLQKYPKDEKFWTLARKWQEKKWSIALHGYDHVYITTNGGINPINYRSEFAGVEIELQCEKIAKGVEKLSSEGIQVNTFFAPSHTYDCNTIRALEECSHIRRISDTIAASPYKEGNFEFFPQQIGRPRNLPLPFLTLCLHPNTMSIREMNKFEVFLKRFKDKCIVLDDYLTVTREKNTFDNLLCKLFFLKRKICRGTV